jgi:predicted nucleotidyltransferase
MASTRQKRTNAPIPMSAIKRYARQVAERFRPEKIILFGSYAYGEPNADSDVDLLVVMPARNELDQAVKIRLANRAPFPLDLIVRKPKNFHERLRRGEVFTTYIVSNGKVLYEGGNGRMGAKSRSRLDRRQKIGPRQDAST